MQQEETEEKLSQKRQLSLTSFVSPECLTFVNAFLLTSRVPFGKEQSSSSAASSGLPSTPVSSSRRLRCRVTPRRLARTRSALLLPKPAPAAIDAAIGRRLPNQHQNSSSSNKSQTVFTLDQLPCPAGPVRVLTTSTPKTTTVVDPPKHPPAPLPPPPPPPPPSCVPSHLQTSPIYLVWHRHIISNTEALSRVASSSLEKFRLAILEICEAEQLLHCSAASALRQLPPQSEASTVRSDTKGVVQLKPRRRSARLQAGGEKSNVRLLTKSTSVCKRVRFCSADLSTCSPPSYGEMGSQKPFERLARHLVSSHRHIRVVPSTDLDVLRLVFQPNTFEPYSFAAGRDAHRFIVSELFESSGERLQCVLRSLVRFYLKSVFNTDDFLSRSSSVTNAVWPADLLKMSGADVGALVCLHLRALHHGNDDAERTAAALKFFNRMRSAFSGRLQFLLGGVVDECLGARVGSSSVLGEGVSEPAAAAAAGHGLYASSVRVEILQRWRSLRIWLSHATELCDSLAWMRPLLDLPSFLQALPGLADY